MGLNRRAFTLLEVLLATAIFALVAASLGASLVGIGRLVRGAYADAELSLELRQERDRLLFQSLREGGQVTWGGLLSARDITVESQALRYEAVGIQGTGGEPIARANQRMAVTNLTERTGLLLVGLSASVKGETRQMRVCLPRFGLEQVRNSSHLFYDGGTP